MLTSFMNSGLLGRVRTPQPLWFGWNDDSFCSFVSMLLCLQTDYLDACCLFFSTLLAITRTATALLPLLLQLLLLLLMFLVLQMLRFQVLLIPATLAAHIRMCIVFSALACAKHKSPQPSKSPGCGDS